MSETDILPWYRRLFGAKADAAEPVPVKREDGWQNPITGVGTWDRDKAQHLQFRKPYENLTLDHERLRTLYHYDPLSRKIVEAWPKHMFRRGWDIESSDPDLKFLPGLQKEEKRLFLRRRMFEGALWGACFGGALAIVQINDGRTPDQPVDEANIRSIDSINVQDRRYINVTEYYGDIRQPNFGEPAMYRVFQTIAAAVDYRNKIPNSSPVFDVHESRVIRFDGDSTDQFERLALGGWSHSVLQAPYEEIKRFMQVFQSASHLLSDASQGVYKIKGLMQMLGSKQGNANLTARMAMMDMARSVARSLLLDADGEEFNRVVTTFTSIPELLDRFMQMLSMVTGIPVTILMGRSAAGMNATGDSDFRAFYDEVASRQSNELEPKLLRAYKLLMLSKAGPTKGTLKEIDIAFRPLWNPTDLERAQVNYTQAQADNLYVTMQAVTPEEIAASRFKNGKTNLTTIVDLEARETATDKGESFDPYPNDPEEEETDGTDANNPNATP